MICLSLSRPIQSSRFFRVTESAARKYSSSTSYSIRIADFNDIPFIRNCNVVNLPENYDNNFYNQQLKTWPELSLVCQDKDENIVGYALGRVLEANELPRLSTDLITYKGHVASIAVTQAHRGHKLAHKMMDLMHMQFALNYDIDEIDLYCRVCYFT